MTISTAGVIGIDEGVPIYDPDGIGRVWKMADLYLGREGKNRYVPKADDLAYERVGSSLNWYVVDEVDETTLVPRFTKLKNSTEGVLTDEDIILGVGPGAQNNTWRIYIDKSVTPHVLATDQRYTVKGSAAMTAKIFRGSVTEGNLKVISAFFDPSGTLLGEDIPLELVDTDNNVSVKQVMPCFTMEDLPDNEPVSVVISNAGGTVLSKQMMLVENTAFIRKPGSAKKYVTGIRLESPFLSKTDPNLIDYPINVPVSALNLMGVVMYSDGSSLKMPVDGTKFSVHGLESYVATIVGQPVGLVLTYTLSADEIAYGAQVGETKHMSELYTARTMVADGAYSVKLFGYPVWIDAVHGYRIEWYLYNLDRQQVFKVTPYVKFNANTRAFDPTNYGVRQALSVSINLRDVSGVFNAYNHVQTIDISLMAPGTARQTNWVIGFDPAQDPQFGVDNSAQSFFIAANQYKVRIDQGETTQEAWLNRLYRLTKPLHDTSREIQAPDPTHFALVFGDNTVEFPISSWSAELSVGYALNNNSTLFVKFFKRTVDNDIQLAICGLPIYQTN